MMNNLTATYNSVGMDGSQVAIKKMVGMVTRQAYLLSFMDIFMALTILFGALVLMTAMLSKPKAPPKAAGGGGH
jgi:DHA2 family multidrug resistance protein